MERDGFHLEVLAPWKTDVFLAVTGSAVPWSIIEQLDQIRIRAIGPAPDSAPEEKQLRTIMGGCSGAMSVSHSREVEAIALELGIPFLVVGDLTTVDPADFRTALPNHSDRTPSYAFLIGRLERDFRQAREAISAAVERAAGIPFLWADDGRHRTNIESTRERTRLLVKHAAFVVADLSLGVESPERENPSRAHEIGMAIAYGRPLMLCSQEPRRHPYYSIGDMQMLFWLTEDELEAGVRQWILSNRDVVRRRVFNYELKNANIQEPAFKFDPRLHFLGPNARAKLDLRRLLALAGVKRK
jgi:hypothetical protein